MSEIEYPVMNITADGKENATSMKSMRFHPLLQKDLNENSLILTIISIEKKTVKIISKQDRAKLLYPDSCMNIKDVLIMINIKMTFSFKNIFFMIADMTEILCRKINIISIVDMA